MFLLSLGYSPFLGQRQQAQDLVVQLGLQRHANLRSGSSAPRRDARVEPTSAFDHHQRGEDEVKEQVPQEQQARALRRRL